MNPEVDKAGNRRWYLNNDLHREDGPAIENVNGTRAWLLKGNYHREDGPAIIYPNGNRLWYLDGKLHREDGPAVEHANGIRNWYFRGRFIPVNSLEEFREATRLLIVEEVQES